MMDNNKTKHEQFWRAGERYKTAREAVINCSKLKEFNVAAFARSLKANFRYAPSEPSVRLFIKADKPMSIQAKEAPFNQQPHYISMCMVTLHETMRDVSVEEDISALHVANVNKLVSELIDANLDSIERLNTQETTQFSENSDSLRTVENMKVCIRGIRAPRIEERHKSPPFPEASPKCPVTPMVPYVNDSNVLIKDESANPTGTHKDRWAFEQLLHYKSELMDQIRGKDDKELVDFLKLSLIVSAPPNDS